MDVGLLPFAHADRAGRTDADTRAASAAGIFVEYRNKGTSDAGAEPDRLLGTSVTAGLAGDAGLREAGFGYRSDVGKAPRRVRAEYRFRASLSAPLAERAFANSEIEGWKGVNE